MISLVPFRGRLRGLELLWNELLGWGVAERKRGEEFRLGYIGIGISRSTFLQTVSRLA
jgi:hypothetical protein